MKDYFILNPGLENCFGRNAISMTDSLEKEFSLIPHGRRLGDNASQIG